MTKTSANTTGTTTPREDCVDTQISCYKYDSITKYTTKTPSFQITGLLILHTLSPIRLSCYTVDHYSVRARQGLLKGTTPENNIIVNFMWHAWKWCS
jgi:hypothetical protein